MTALRTPITLASYALYLAGIAFLALWSAATALGWLIPSVSPTAAHTPYAVAAIGYCGCLVTFAVRYGYEMRQW